MWWKLHREELALCLIIDSEYSTGDTLRTCLEISRTDFQRFRILAMVWKSKFSEQVRFSNRSMESPSRAIGIPKSLKMWKYY